MNKFLITLFNGREFTFETTSTFQQFLSEIEDGHTHWVFEDDEVIINLDAVALVERLK